MPLPKPSPYGTNAAWEQDTQYAQQHVPYPSFSNLNEWAADVEFLDTLGTTENVTNTLIAWGKAEGGTFNNPDTGNVLGTSVGAPGSYATNSAGVQKYATQDEGLVATVDMFHQSNMAGITSALHSSNPEANLPSALEADPWGTSGEFVATLLGETLGAIGSAGGTSSGGNGIILAGNNEGSTSTTPSVKLLTVFGKGIGLPTSLIVRGTIGIVGIILLIIALKEMFANHDAVQTITTQPVIYAGKAAKKGGAVKDGIKALGAGAVVAE